MTCGLLGIQLLVGSSYSQSPWKVGSLDGRIVGAIGGAIDGAIDGTLPGGTGEFVGVYDGTIVGDIEGGVPNIATIFNKRMITQASEYMSSTR